MEILFQHTLNDSKKDDDDEKEESDIEEDAIYFIRVTIWWVDFVSYASSRSHPHVQVEDIALLHLI